MQEPESEPTLNPKSELVKNWLIKAKRDLNTAKRLSKEPEPYLDTAIYHCQQAVEKAVKGFLVFNDIRFEKTHDIEVLIQLAIPVNEEFSNWLDAGETLTPYATAYRYPGENVEPSKEEFDEALKTASDIFSFILNILPVEVHP
ncbi:MAG: HEPN domain-containing protein [Ignavibacteriaceae bacterium]